MLPKFYTLLPLLVSLALAGDLKVQRDKSVEATHGHKDGQYVWSSIVDVDFGLKETDAKKKEEELNGKMVKIAHEASKEMRDDFSHILSSVPKDKRPSIMTAIEVDNQVYLASSMKGDYSFIYEYKTKDKGGKVGDGTIRKSVPKEIATALGGARAAGAAQHRNNVQHQNDASCGELMASYTWLLKNHGKSLKDKKPKRTIAWLYTGTVDQAHDPCGTDEATWGCDMFCKSMGFEVINKKTVEAKELPTIKGHDHQKLMTPALRKELDDMNKAIDEENKRKQKEKSDKKKAEKEQNKNKHDDKKDDKKADKKGHKGHGHKREQARSWSA
ncbi:hypothetical protein ASPWEDRAFT_39532 [Aspergillus wentii DTO 134E9]|uniref:Uncharacterized protein n=1 Tax=Aspergillus wentii DTO 134E9 TaxID=1073089 RepID=A0A1L9RSC6_ASPWE|nr:uncharacterized protein ASPWEDRAFT_39532 [Aspergillus wentii DTO 134E9]OJJ37794.1 hypothetical protein ASPWEDRAFT_39532 [Aspergillus wentii DTO 134E9]